MKIKSLFSLPWSVLSIAAALCLTISASPAIAASVPYLSLASNSGSSQVTVTVYAADPNVSVLLYYPSATSYASINIGATNASGYLMTTINSSTYGIAASAPVYVIVDGQQSQTQAWPNYSSSGGLSLSQSSVSLSAGQSTVVTASVSAPLSLSTNTNPSVAAATLSGNQISISGNAFGTSAITVCAANIGCGTIQVSVSSSVSTGQSSVSFSQSTLTLPAGQSQQISVSGSGSYYISANSNSGVVSANLSGSTLSVTGISAGTASLSICSSSSGSTTCGTVNVTVTASSAVTNTTTTSSLSFSQSSVNLTVGQNQTVSIYGGTNASTVYYVSNNSAPGSVTTSVNSANLSLTGVAFGGANITVCQSGGPCGNIYAYVSPSNTAAAPVSSVTATPTLSSFSISSNDAGGSFASVGNALSVTFNTNQTINTPSLTVGGSPVSVSGSGSGPYTASYTIPASGPVVLPISITFTNPAGTGGQAHFWVSNTTSSVFSPAAGAVSSYPSGYTYAAQPGRTTTSNSSYDFTSYLYVGMTAEGTVNPDVKALQQRLKADGLFSDAVTGYFGPLTKSAVEAYQKKHGLKPIGVIGPGTRQLLNQGI